MEAKDKEISVNIGARFEKIDSIDLSHEEGEVIDSQPRNRAESNVSEMFPELFEASNEDGQDLDQLKDNKSYITIQINIELPCGGRYPEAPVPQHL